MVSGKSKEMRGAKSSGASNGPPWPLDGEPQQMAARQYGPGKVTGGPGSVMPQRLLLRVPEACEMCAIGKTKGYELVASGVWPSIHIGAAVRVPLDGLTAWLEEQLEDQD